MFCDADYWITWLSIVIVYGILSSNAQCSFIYCVHSPGARPKTAKKNLLAFIYSLLRSVQMQKINIELELAVCSYHMDGFEKASLLK